MSGWDGSATVGHRQTNVILTTFLHHFISFQTWMHFGLQRCVIIKGRPLLLCDCSFHRFPKMRLNSLPSASQVRRLQTFIFYTRRTTLSHISSAAGAERIQQPVETARRAWVCPTVSVFCTTLTALGSFLWEPWRNLYMWWHMFQIVRNHEATISKHSTKYLRYKMKIISCRRIFFFWSFPFFFSTSLSEEML